MKKCADGRDLNNCLPYLSAYLGHEHSRLSKIFATDCWILYQVMRRWETRSHGPKTVIYINAEQIEYQFDLVYKRTLVSDYLYSRNFSERLRGIAIPHDYFYGLESVQHYLNALKNAQPGIRLSQVPSYTLWEHKKLMYQRMQFILDQGLTTAPQELLQIMNRYRVVVQKAATARLLLMKYNIDFNKASVAVAEKEILEMIALERELLNQFHDLVSKK